MRGACFYAVCMGTMVQIRNVPDALHRRLKSRAALAGMSLSDCLLSEIRQVAGRPTFDELRARLHSRTETSPGHLAQIELVTSSGAAATPRAHHTAPISPG
jgi:antitoxin FitA